MGDGGGVSLSQRHYPAGSPGGKGGQFAPTGKGGGSVPIEQTTPSQKSILAKQHSRRVASDVQRYSEEVCEAQLAKGLKGAGKNALAMPDNEPPDVITTFRGKITDGIELKVMTDNKNNKLTMKASAIQRKQNWMQENLADFHTVVFDDQQVFNAMGEGQHGSLKNRRIFYRRGSGSFRVENMHEVKSMAALRAIIEMPTADLPDAAQPTAGYQGFK